MEVWLESGSKVPGVDRVVDEDLIIDGNAIYIEGKQVGRRVDVSNSSGQATARSMAGSVSWILLDLGEWKMIPIENIIAACDGGPTKVAARISSPEQVLGAAFALEIGVDALLVPSDTLGTALIAKSQRNERDSNKFVVESKTETEVLSEFVVTDVKEGGVGDRICVDMIDFLEIGEGIVVGSSSKSMVLVHGETIDSEFVPTRPFRVNAGAANCYTLMSNGETKYLSELKMGDEILVLSSTGLARKSVIGRIKIERRPFIMVKWIDGNNNEAGTFLQQAETVRLVGGDSKTISITELKVGDKIIGRDSTTGRHVGQPINAKVTER